MALTAVRTWLTGRGGSATVHCVTLILLVFVIPASILMLSASRTAISFQMSSSTDSMGQIFYSETRSYSEAKSQTFRVYKGMANYEVGIVGVDVSALRYIRVDPAEDQASGVMSEVRVISRGSSVSVQDLYASATPLNAIALDAAPNGALGFRATAADPYFEIQVGEIAPVSEPSLRYFSIYLSLAGLFIFCGLAVVWARWERVQEVSLRPGTIYLVAIFLCGIGLITIVPPFQSPDEFKHFERANMIASGHLGLIRDGETVGGFVSPSLEGYMKHFDHLPFHPQSRLSEQALGQARAINWDEDLQFIAHIETAPYLPLIYSPQVVAIKIGQAMNLSIHQTYLFARFSVLVTSLLLCLVAFSLCSPTSLTLVLLAMPMMLFQLSAATIDGVTVGLGLLGASLFLSLSLRSGASFSSAKFLALLLVLLLLCGARPYLLPMYLLPLYLAISEKNRGFQAATIVGGFLSVGWVLFGTMQAVDDRVVVGASRSEILLYYMAHPIEFVSLIGRTLDMFAINYYQQFVGVLGWLDTPLSSTTYLVAALVLGFTLGLLTWRRWTRDEAINLTVLTAVSIASVVLIFIALLLNWSEHPAAMVQGVQGRYFTIPVLLIAYGFTSASSVLGKKTALLYVTALGWLALSYSGTVGVLLDRYYL